jgi:outer membrane receptor for monomeric catechols
MRFNFSRRISSYYLLLPPERHKGVFASTPDYGIPQRDSVAAERMTSLDSSKADNNSLFGVGSTSYRHAKQLFSTTTCSRHIDGYNFDNWV